MSKPPSTATVETLHDGFSIGDHKQNVLVNLTGTGIDHRLVSEAGRYAAGTGGRLVLVCVMSSRAFADRQRAYAESNALRPYALDQAEETCRRRAARIGREALDPLGIDYTAVGMVGREVTQVLTAAHAYECGHVFLVDRPHSLLRRLVSRTLVQAVTHTFDGFVTVVRTEHDGETPIERTASSPV